MFLVGLFFVKYSLKVSDFWWFFWFFSYLTKRSHIAFTACRAFVLFKCGQYSTFLHIGECVITFLTNGFFLPSLNWSSEQEDRPVSRSGWMRMSLFVHLQRKWESSNRRMWVRLSNWKKLEPADRVCVQWSLCECMLQAWDSVCGFRCWWNSEVSSGDTRRTEYYCDPIFVCIDLGRLAPRVSINHEAPTTGGDDDRCSVGQRLVSVEDVTVCEWVLRVALPRSQKSTGGSVLKMLTMEREGRLVRVSFRSDQHSLKGGGAVVQIAPLTVDPSLDFWLWDAETLRLSASVHANVAEGSRNLKTMGTLEKVYTASKCAVCNSA